MIDARLGFAFLDEARSWPGAAGEACRAFARAAAAWRALEEHGPLTADSARALARVEQELDRCDG